MRWHAHDGIEIARNVVNQWRSATLDTIGTSFIFSVARTEILLNLSRIIRFEIYPRVLVAHLLHMIG